MENRELIERLNTMINSSYWGATTELFKDCKQTIIQQQAEIERLNTTMKVMCVDYENEVKRLKSNQEEREIELVKEALYADTSLLFSTQCYMIKAKEILTQFNNEKRR